MIWLVEIAEGLCFMPLPPLLSAPLRQGLWKSLDTPHNPLKNAGLLKIFENRVLCAIKIINYF
jgi:hypothetical protein